MVHTSTNVSLVVCCCFHDTISITVISLAEVLTASHLNRHQKIGSKPTKKPMASGGGVVNEDAW